MSFFATPDEATVHFSWDGGLSWEEEALTLSNELIEGDIPKYLDRGVVQYYVEMVDT